MLCKLWGYYNKFDSMKSLGVCYWYVKMSRCGCVEHGLENITVYVQGYITHLAACSGRLLVRDGPLGVPEFVKLAYYERRLFQSPTLCRLGRGGGTVYFELKRRATEATELSGTVCVKDNWLLRCLLLMEHATWRLLQRLLTWYHRILFKSLQGRV